VKITDPRAIRALAHPLRLDLIELLGTLGPTTAADCARRLGTSQASCSFHLRQLAKYGFVEEAQASPDGRKRPWQLTDLEQSWSSDVGPAADHLERVFVQREADRMLHWIGRSSDEPKQWRESSFLGGATLPLSPAELDGIGDQLRAVLEPYVRRLEDRRDWPSDARFVRVVLSSVPLDDAGGGANESSSPSEP
jgi:DNA-binding MarR family transcriptional regulator